MLKTIVGILILLFPFLLINKFKDKKLGFAYILSFAIAFHLFVAIFTQAFRIFTYPVILGINLIILIIIILKNNFIKIIQKIRTVRLDWILILIIIIAFVHLFSVHYNYSGRVTVFNGEIRVNKEVKNMKYPYPYFSDEWHAIAVAKYSIASRSLPFSNPLLFNGKFVNLEFPFHSFVSELVLLLDLDPLTDYTKLTIFTGLLVCVLIYVFLRINKVNKFAAGISSLSALYITNGANLPGLWNLIPIILGIISMLLVFIFISLNNKLMVFLTITLTLFFYPPLLIFCAVVLLSKLIFSKVSIKEKIKELSYYLILAAFVAVILATSYFFVNKSIKSFIHYILFSKIFYTSITQNLIPQFLILEIIPISILVLSFIGVVSVIKKKIWLVNLLFLGLLYWGLYSFAIFRFIIEYSRVVVFTSVLIIIFAGFGLNFVIRLLKSINFFKKRHILDYILIGIMLLFIIFSFNYTKRENWMELKLVDSETKKTYLPAAPANNYLHPDDLKLFENIKEKRFLSIPWKGTVIGVATDNYPLETKQGTISNRVVKFSNFMKANCKRKIKLAKKRKIDYVYATEINCLGMELVGTSSEGLYLYKFSID